MSYDVIVLGAGLAGLSAASRLRSHDISFCVLEKAENPGGLLRSQKIQGYTFDCTGHLLHSHTQEFKNFLQALFPEGLKEKQRKAVVHIHDQWIDYPIQTYFKQLREPLNQNCLNGLKKASLEKSNRKQLNLFFLSTFGKGLNDIFFEPYHQKLFQTPLDQITCEWMGRFLPKVSLSEIKKDKKENIGYNASFKIPPSGGIQSLIQKMISFYRLSEQIHCSEEISSISLKEKILNTKSGKQFRFKKLISTIPLSSLASLIHKEDPDCPKLDFFKWISVWNLNLGFKEPAPINWDWAYFPSPKLPFYRVGCYSNLLSSFAPPGHSSFYVECSFLPKKIPSKKLLKTSHTEHCLERLQKLKIIPPLSKLQISSSQCLEHAYVLFDKNRSKIRDWINSLSSKSILPCGRFGRWTYYSMEETYLDGVRSAQKTIDNW